jgi:starvation-inducible DNA-binding protein
MSNKILSLKAVLADSYALYLKTQNYHWNVEGKNFYSLHSMFEAQYTELADVVDMVAELIRGLGEKVPASFDAFSKQTSIKSGNENLSAEEMLKELTNDQMLIQKTLNNALSIFEKEGDEVVAGFLIDRLTAHRKAHWILKSSS